MVPQYRSWIFVCSTSIFPEYFKHPIQLESSKAQQKAGVEANKVITSILFPFPTCSQFDCSYCRYRHQLQTLSLQLKLQHPVARTCHLIFIVLDVLKPLGDKKIIETELEGFGIRLNKKPPNVTVRKKEKGGIAITNTVPLTNIDHDEIKAILSEYRINNADIAIREPNTTADDLVDVIEGNRYFNSAVIITK
jgi:hypothetical protein